MKKFTVVTALILSAALAHAGPIRQVSWGGRVAAGADTSQMSGNAQTTAGGAVRGQAEFHIVVGADTTTIHAVVNCLSVTGTQAWMSGTVTHSNDPRLVGQTILWTVVDGGEPSAGADFGAFSAAGERIDCATQPALALLPWVDGNVQVR